MNTGSSAQRWAAPAVAVLIAVYIGWTQAGLGGPAVTRAFSDITIGLAAAAAGLACVAASRRLAGWPGRGWLLIGAGMTCWAIGEAIWSGYEVVLGREVPFPSLADAGFLLMVPLTLVGMTAMLNFRRGALRTLFDALMVAGSLLFVSWPIVLEPIYRAGGQGLFAQSIALAYPIGDIVVASMAFVLLSQTTRSARGTLALAGVGMAGLAIADSGFAYLTLHEAYASAGLIDVGWLAGFLLVALAGLRMRAAGGTAERRDAVPLLVALPYVPLTAAVMTAITVQLTRGTLGTFLFLTLMIIVVLVILRQLVTLDENLTLTRRLHDLAYHDQLTGLANRSLLQRRTELAAGPLGVLYIDLDDFKQVNDGFGHATGDELLVLVAARLRACARPADTVARIGGDEFAVLLDGLDDPHAAEAVARRVVAELARPFDLAGHTVRISASVGVAVQEAGAGPPGDLMRDADIAMYNAKFSGKNDLVCFDAGLRDRISTASRADSTATGTTPAQPGRQAA